MKKQLVTYAIFALKTQALIFLIISGITCCVKLGPLSVNELLQFFILALFVSLGFARAAMLSDSYSLNKGESLKDISRFFLIFAVLAYGSLFRIGFIEKNFLILIIEVLVIAVITRKSFLDGVICAVGVITYSNLVKDPSLLSYHGMLIDLAIFSLVLMAVSFLPKGKIPSSRVS